MGDPTIQTALVVEDDPMLCDAYARVLQHRCKLHVIAARDLATARRLAREHQPDVALVDLGLPDGSGIELIAELCAARIGSRHFLVSSNNSTATTVAAMQAGATNVLDKPMSAVELEHYISGAPVEPTGPAEFQTGALVFWEYVQRVFRACGGNKSEAARQLGIDRGTLARWLGRSRPAR